MKKISTIQFCSIAYFLMLANNMGLTKYVMFHYAKQDSIISIIIGSILGLIPLFIYLKIIDKKPELNIFEKIDYLFPKLGKIISLVLTATITYFIAINYNNLIKFISSQYLSKTPSIVIALSFLPAITYILTKGTTVIGRTIFILLIISIIFVFLTIGGLIWQVKIENLLPILENGIKDPLICSFIYITFNISPLFLLTTIAKNNITDKDKLKKRMIITYVIANMVTLIIFFLTLAVLGKNLTMLYQYPEYDVIKKVSLIGFIERTESTISLTWIFYVFAITVIGIQFICEYIKHTFKIINKKTNNKIIILTSLIITIWGNLIFQNNTSFELFIYNKLPYMFAIILILIPIIIALKKVKN